MRVVAANGVAYGPPRRASAWGTFGCPILPRAYRAAYGSWEAPLALKELAGDEDLTVAELGWSIWERLGVNNLSRSARKALHQFVTGLAVPAMPEVIPKGIPLSWVRDLPLRTRTRNAVERLIGEYFGSENPLGHPVSVDMFLAQPAVGRTTLVDLLCVVESAEVSNVTDRSSDTPRNSSDNDSASRWVDVSIQEFAAWAVAETGVSTLGDAISYVFEEKADVDEWRQLAQLRLQEFIQEPRHPYTLLDEWVAGLPEREQLILGLRMARPRDPYTLQQLADELDVTRERVRQLEKRIRRELDSFLESQIARPIVWRVATLRRQLGVAAPHKLVAPLLSPPEGSSDFGNFLLKLAGPYEASSGWYVLRSTLEHDPTSSIRQATDEVGRIDMAYAHSALAKWGLKPSFHEVWLTRDGKIRNIGGCLVRWDGPIADKLAFALADLGKPATPEQLLAHIGEDRSLGSCKNALFEDARFMRTNRSEWALSTWGLPEYNGIAAAIQQVLDRGEPPMLVDDVVEQVRADFGIAEGSARAYCEAAMFVVEDGWIRFRRPNEPYDYGNASIRDASGVFALGEDRMGLLFEVDRDVLRGSGRQLSLAAGAILRVDVGDRPKFKSSDGTSVSVTFPGTARMGPSLGSTRSLAEAAGADLGDLLLVILDRQRMSVEAVVTDVAAHEAGWPLVARLTGIDAGSGMDGLAEALHCARGEVRAILRDRKDDVVLAALPVARSAPDLEEALEALAAEVWREESS